MIFIVRQEAELLCNLMLCSVLHFCSHAFDSHTLLLTVLYYTALHRTAQHSSTIRLSLMQNQGIAKIRPVSFDDCLAGDVTVSTHSTVYNVQSTL